MGAEEESARVTSHVVVRLTLEGWEGVKRGRESFQTMVVLMQAYKRMPCFVAIPKPLSGEPQRLFSPSGLIAIGFSGRHQTAPIW